MGALEAAAQASNCRALIIIDALNEGEGRNIWPAHLPSFLARCEKSPWISILVSIRSPYETLVVPESVRTQAMQLTHEGFGDQDYDAVQTFFSYYELEFPSAPILQAEFRNPLFLKTICKGLHDNGETRIPRGLQGITAVFSLYLDSINKQLAADINYNPKDHLVRTALDELPSCWLAAEPDGFLG